MQSHFQKFRKNVYSQNGEDGVLSELLRRLDISIGWFCEFGAWDGKYGSNTYRLLKNGWSGVMIEGDQQKYKLLEKTASKFSNNLYVFCNYVSPYESPNCLDVILAKNPIPQEFEVLSIDVDGLDYQIFASLKHYYPVIVIIEINSSLLPGVEQIHDDERQGSSFTSMLKLAFSKGYELVCHAGNMIFVRKDFIDLVKLPAEERKNPEKLFVTDWVNPTRLQVWKRKLRNLSLRRIWVKFENFFRG